MLTRDANNPLASEASGVMAASLGGSRSSVNGILPNNPELRWNIVLKENMKLKRAEGFFPFLHKDPEWMFEVLNCLVTEYM